MKAKEEEHQWELEAAEAEFNAEEAEHKGAITKNIDEEHTNGLKDIHKDLLEKVCA